MRRFPRCLVIAFALLASIDLAAAAEAGSGETGPLYDKSPLYLTTAQEQWICQHLTGEKAQSVPAGFHAGIGDRVPPSVTLHPLPKRLLDQIPSARMYEVAKLPDNTLLLVDPRDREVVDVIAAGDDIGEAANADAAAAPAREPAGRKVD